MDESTETWRAVDNPLLTPALELVAIWSESWEPAQGYDNYTYALHRLFNRLQDNWPVEYQAAFDEGIRRAELGRKTSPT